MGTLMAYGPDVVGLPGGPLHGLVELWKNPSPTSAFSGQKITINDFDSTLIDEVIIICGHTTENRGLTWLSFERAIYTTTAGLSLIIPVFYNHISKAGTHSRSLWFSLSGTTLELNLGDGYENLQTSIGSAASSKLANEACIPVRILGLIHED